MSELKNILFETERLYLRRMFPEDAHSAFELNNDLEVLKYTGDVAFKDVAEAKTFLEKYSHFDDYGFGRWAVMRKEDGIFLGWCGLKFHPDKNEVDIGYRFGKKFWNNGYASEAAMACLDYGFKKFGFESIIANVMRENKASIRVLEKIGMHYEADNNLPGECDLRYRIYAPFTGF